jgi:putative colanic acid biosynthesis acetyltransferase WcaF
MIKRRLDLYQNQTYDSGRSTIIRLLWWVIGRCFVNTYLPIPMGVKKWILTSFGAKIGDGFVIKPKVLIKYPWFLEVGDHCWIGEKVWIDNLCLVRLESHVCLSQGALLLTGNHNYKKEGFDLMTGKILLKEGTWVGAKAVVCPNITTCANSIITAGSVLQKNTELEGVYQGNPAILKSEKT